MPTKDIDNLFFCLYLPIYFLLIYSDIPFAFSITSLIPPTM